MQKPKLFLKRLLFIRFFSFAVFVFNYTLLFLYLKKKIFSSCIQYLNFLCKPKSDLTFAKLRVCCFLCLSFNFVLVCQFELWIKVFFCFLCFVFFTTTVHVSQRTLVWDLRAVFVWPCRLWAWRRLGGVNSVWPAEVYQSPGWSAPLGIVYL